MIKITFSESAGQITSFKVSGHATSGTEDMKGRIICSAVSSAVYLTANTLTDVLGAEIDYNDSGKTFSLQVLSKLDESQVTLKGLKLHVTELSKDYPKNITVSSEV